MKRALYLLWMVAALAVACSESNEAMDSTTEPPQNEEPVPPVGPYLEQITLLSEVVSLAPNSTGEIRFVVSEPDYLFNYALSSAGCQVSLRRAEERLKSPSEVDLVRIVEGDAAGEYIATVQDNGSLNHYSTSICLAIKESSGAVCYSNAMRLKSESYLDGLTSLSLLRSENPSLEGDVHFDYDPATRTFSAYTPNYVRTMEFVAHFETEGEVEAVKVGDKLQQSGLSINNFRQELIYTVLTKGQELEYRVRLSNFTGVPVMWIETPNHQAITSKDVWLEDATIFIDGMGQFEDLETMTLSIRGRGNSTWGYEKKPYNIKLSSKEEILGMPKHKRWCLLANYMDRTMLRNRIAYRLAEVTSLDWTPRTRFVELFLNGRHQGSYLLAEHIKVDENRVNITELEPEQNTAEELTGGYLLELDFHFDNEWQWHSSHNIPFAVKYPEEEDLTGEQLAWIKEHISEVEGVLYGADYRDAEQGYAAYLDAQSFVDYWLIYELAVNHELANPGSVYLHKDRGGKLMAGPVWDFDWGTFSFKASPAAQHGLFMTHAWWYGRLFGDEAFKRLATERWQILKPAFQEVATQFLEQERAYTARSSEYNFKLWSISTDINGDEKLPVQEAVDRMKEVLESRIEIIDRELAEWK